LPKFKTLSTGAWGEKNLRDYNYAMIMEVDGRIELSRSAIRTCGSKSAQRRSGRNRALGDQVESPSPQREGIWGAVNSASTSTSTASGASAIIGRRSPKCGVLRKNLSPFRFQKAPSDMRDGETNLKEENP
jgi:hypothetical protein